MLPGSALRPVGTSACQLGPPGFTLTSPPRRPQPWPLVWGRGAESVLSGLRMSHTRQPGRVPSPVPASWRLVSSPPGPLPPRPRPQSACVGPGGDPGRTPGPRGHHSGRAGSTAQPTGLQGGSELAGAAHWRLRGSDWPGFRHVTPSEPIAADIPGTGLLARAGQVGDDRAGRGRPAPPQLRGASSQRPPRVPGCR